MSEIIRFKKLSETAKPPFHGSELAAGYDLYSDIDCDIYPGYNEKIPTNIAMEIPEGYFGAIFPRSGLATKQGLRMANSTGIIDADYRGNIICAIYNDSKEMRHISKGDRIAQLIILPYLPIEFIETSELSDTARGESGFGHSGTN